MQRIGILAEDLVGGCLATVDYSKKAGFPRIAKYIYSVNSCHQDPVWKDRVFSCVKTRQKCSSFLLCFSMRRTIFFCVLTKKTGRATSKCRGSAGLFCASTAVCAGCFQCFCTWFVRFLSVKKLVILGQKGKATGLFCTKTPTKFTGGEEALQRESLKIVLYFYLSVRL